MSVDAPPEVRMLVRATNHVRTARRGVYMVHGGRMEEPEVPGENFWLALVSQGRPLLVVLAESGETPGNCYWRFRRAFDEALEARRV